MATGTLSKNFAMGGADRAVLLSLLRAPRETLSISSVDDCPLD